MRRAQGTRISGLVVALAIAMNLPSMAVAAGSRLIVLAQTMIPRTGMMDAQNRYLSAFRNPRSSAISLVCTRRRGALSEELSQLLAWSGPSRGGLTKNDAMTQTRHSATCRLGTRKQFSA